MNWGEGQEVRITVREVRSGGYRIALLKSITISELSSLLTCVHKNYDDRKKRTTKKVCVTNVTGLSLACFVVIFILY